MNLFSKNGEAHDYVTEKLRPVSHVYKDKQGNNYYAFKNPSDLPALRALAAFVYTKESDLNLTKERLAELFDKLTTAINSSDLKTAGTLVSLGQSAMEMYCEEAILLKIATCYFLMNSEDQVTYHGYVQDDKLKAWDQDQDAKAFFLTSAYQYTVKFSQQQGLNVPKYLDEVRNVLNELDYHLPLSKWSGTLSQMFRS